MSEYRDPRIDPRADDVLLCGSFATQVIDVGEEVEAYDITGAELRMSHDDWRTLTRGAVVLWQDDAPPPADVALLAAANRTLAERAERAERERDEARRVLLALADACESEDDAWRVLYAVERALGIAAADFGGLLPGIAAALRRLCGVSDG